MLVQPFSSLNTPSLRDAIVSNVLVDVVPTVMIFPPFLSHHSVTWLCLPSFDKTLNAFRGCQYRRH